MTGSMQRAMDETERRRAEAKSFIMKSINITPRQYHESSAGYYGRCVC